MNTNKANINQHRAIAALLKKLNIAAQREQLIWIYSDKRTKSGADLSSTEAANLIRYLKSQDPEEKKAEVMRKKIIALAHKMNWYKSGEHKVDMLRIDSWCLKFSYLKKKLNQYRYSELPLLVTQFESVYASFLKVV